MTKAGKESSGKKKNGSLQASEAPQRQPKAMPPARRSFLNRLWLLLAAVGAVEFIVMLTYFFRPRKPRAARPDGDMLVTAGRISDYLPGSVTAFPQGRFYLVRLADGGFLALSRQCTHLGCTVPWDADRQQFACPCHASVFDMAGRVLNAPAPRPLDRFPVAIENDVITVDTRQRVRRSQFKDDDILYAQNQAR